jgi:hypothetical protein
MGIAVHMSKTQILALVFFIVSLIVIGLVVLHAAAPSLWHTLFSAKIAGVSHHY